MFAEQNSDLIKIINSYTKNEETQFKFKLRVQANDEEKKFSEDPEHPGNAFGAGGSLSTSSNTNKTTGSFGSFGTSSGIGQTTKKYVEVIPLSDSDPGKGYVYENIFYLKGLYLRKQFQDMKRENNKKKLDELNKSIEESIAKITSLNDDYKEIREKSKEIDEIIISLLKEK